ncbi:MAG: MFS transporter [Alphaproteobacteria bacterium]|nr:MFS transporter [Alphaproteobacteria bacterium]
MHVLSRLKFSAYGMHFADQIALVSVPLIAKLVFGASAETIGILVACQSMAHLLGSLPFGVVVDNAQSRTVAIASTIISVLGFAGAAVCIYVGSLFWFGVSVTFGGFGIVLFVLVSLSILPKIEAGDRLAKANAQIEIPRALMSFLVPLGVGVVISAATAQWVFAAATVGGLAALLVATGLPCFSMATGTKEKTVKQVFKAGVYVARQKFLLPIALCAIFWNVAFFALLVAMAPLIVDVYQADPGVFGFAMAAFGFGSVAGSWAAGRFSTQIPPNVILLFGPGSSVVALIALTLTPPDGPIGVVYGAFLLLGFGPGAWLVSQNSIRQMVTPSAMLGSVNAVIQTAIYGVRPLGAMLGGALVEATSPEASLVFVAIAYAGSFAAALFSPLRALRRYSDLSPEPAA